MTQEQLIARIQRVFEETFDLAAPAPQTDIMEASVLDSLALMMFLFEIELHFGMEIPFVSLEFTDFSTIERIARLVS